MMDDQTTGAHSDDSLLIRRKRALYRAQHRGTKEMDWMIGRFADAKIGSMSADQLETFEMFLEVGDPEINAWLLEPSLCNESAYLGLIEEIRGFNSLA